MTRDDFRVGQTVYLFRERNHCSNSTIEERIIETKVISIGRKYLAVDYWGRTEFDMTNGFREKTVYSPTFALYLTKDDIYQMIETNRMRSVVREKMDRSLSRIPLEGLQEIIAAIDKYTEVKADE